MMTEKSGVPTSKVAAAGVGGAAALVLTYLLGLFGLDLPAEVASALTTLVAFGAAYVKAERRG